MSTRTRKNENEYGAALDKNGYAYSIVQLNTDCQCYFCSKSNKLNRHEVFQGVGLREKSKRYGLWVSLCIDCHSYIHNNPLSQKATSLNENAERLALEHYGWTTDDFIRIMGKNYI